MIFGREEGAEVVIEPPGDSGRGGIFEIDDGVFVAGKVGLIKQRAGAVDEAVKLVFGVWADALLVESAE